MTGKIAGWIERLHHIIRKTDGLPLWWVGLLLFCIVISPNLILGEGSVFTVHDQLDESMMNYVLTARHPGEGIIPEMLGGINASGLAPSAVLFIPLYRLLPPFYAFLCTYSLLFLGGFLGMYLAVRELTDSSILAVAAAGLFCMLPLYPVYGFSQMGIPMILYAFLCLSRKKRIPIALTLVTIFGLTSHLVYTGYAVLGLWLLALTTTALQRKINMHAHRLKGEAAHTDPGTQKWTLAGFILLLSVYLLTNLSLITEILFGRSLNGQAAYVSHREEMVNGAMPFGRAVRDMFMSSGQHAFTYHEKLILPIVLSLILGGIFYRKLNRQAKGQYLTALGGMAILLFIAVFYGVCKSGPVTAWKNNVTGFLHYFQIERFYWLYPAGWYLEFAMAASCWWTTTKKMTSLCSLRAILLSLPIQCAAIALILLPTANTVLHNSDFYRNVNQKNNGSGITGYISWESYYSEELMEQLEQAIGRKMSDYRIAHLGVSPAPSLMHGFYTMDGYSNNYPLEYKHAFRRVIAGELDKSPETAVYFDKWGNRCYLFNSLSGNYWMLPKDSGVVYEGLEFDMQALRDLGCEYIFSGGEIADADRMGLESLGYFDTEDSYWGIWLYALTQTQSAIPDNTMP